MIVRLEGREGLERLPILISPSQVYVCLRLCGSLLFLSFWGVHFSIVSPHCFGAELSESLCRGYLNLGQAEPQQVRTPHGEEMGLTGWAKRGNSKHSHPCGILRLQGE